MKVVIVHTVVEEMVVRRAGAAVALPQPFVEAAVNRAIRQVRAEMPFTEHPGAVAIRAEGVGHGQFTGAEVISGGDGVPDFDVMGIFPGHQRTAGRRTGGVHVKIREARGLGVEPVELRRANDRVAVRGDVTIAHVVHDEDDDVGLACVGGHRRAAKNQCTGQDDENVFQTQQSEYL